MGWELHISLTLSLTNPNLNENEVALGFVITNMVNKPFRGIFLLNDWGTVWMSSWFILPNSFMTMKVTPDDEFNSLL